MGQVEQALGKGFLANNHDDGTTSRPNIGALIIRIGFWGECGRKPVDEERNEGRRVHPQRMCINNCKERVNL